MNLRYTPKALTELAEILAYIAERSPQGARNVQARIQAITALLGQYPYSGQFTSESGLRRIVTSPYPYLIFYEATAEEVVILAFVMRHENRSCRAASCAHFPKSVLHLSTTFHGLRKAMGYSQAYCF